MCLYEYFLRVPEVSPFREASTRRQPTKRVRKPGPQLAQVVEGQQPAVLCCDHEIPDLSGRASKRSRIRIDQTTQDAGRNRLRRSLIARQNDGVFEVWTGDVTYRLEGGKKRGFTKIPELPGTGVRFSLDTRRPVDLAETWIASSDWSFINVEAERIDETGGISIADACVHTGSRLPALRLRRKLVAVLPEMEGPLVLDFSGVRSASSSFLDELLGRFADSLGRDTFEDRVRCIGMTPTLRKMANVVIAQRLEGLSESTGAADRRDSFRR